MNSVSIEKKIMTFVQDLSYKSRQQVLAYVRELKMSQSNSVSGKELLKFAGTINKADLITMSKAIEEGCERIDSDEW